MQRITLKREVTVRQQVEFVSLTDVHQQQRDVADDESDPYRVLRAKTKALAELLECDEAQAERLILQRCDKAFA